MIEVRAVIKGICDLLLFKVDAPKKLIHEIAESIKCEQIFNKSKLSFDGLIYDFVRKRNGKS